MLGLFGDPNMLEYGCGHLDANGQVVATTASQYASSAGPLRAVLRERSDLHRFGPPVVGTVPGRRVRHPLVGRWSTFILMKLIKFVLRGARYKDEVLEVGDLAIHGEEAFPDEAFAGSDRRSASGPAEAVTRASLDDNRTIPYRPGGSGS